MRTLLLNLLGIACIALGGLILSGRLTHATNHQTVDLGIIRATTEMREPLPQWTGFAALALGTGLLLVAGRRRA